MSQTTINKERPCSTCHGSENDLMKCGNLVHGEDGRTGSVIECPACLCPCENEDCDQSPYYDW